MHVEVAMKTIIVAVSIACALVSASTSAAGGDDNRGRYYDDDRISYSLGLNFGYPYGYGAHYPHYGYYPGYGPYRLAYGSRIGVGYRSGYYDAFSLYFSLPLNFRPRYEPAPTVLVPSEAPATQSRPRDCLQQREYQTEIFIDGTAVQAYGTACLQADGSWRIVDGPFASD